MLKLRTRFGVVVAVASVVLGAIALNGTVGLPPLPVVGSAPERARLGPQIPVTATNATADQANNSPMVVADPGDERFLALANRIDAPDYSCSLHVSGDWGQRWTPVEPVPELPPGAEKCYGPEVAIDGQGAIHFLFLGLEGAGNLPMGAFLTTSTDRGRTFSPPRRVLDRLNFAVRMAVDPEVGEGGRMHLAWLHAGAEPGLGSLGTSDNPILSAYSDDGGETFSEPVRVSGAEGQRAVAPALALGGDGQVQVAYYDLLEDFRDYQGLEGPVWEGAWALVVASSSDGGRSFGPGVVAEPEVVPYERVMVIFTMAPPALVTRGDQVCVAWGDGRLGDADVFARCSPDGGASWEAARRVNDDAEASGRWQYLPQLGLAPNGRLDAVYFDRRDDPENLRNEVTYTHSYDSGQTFAGGVRLTTTGASLTLIGQQYAIPTGGPERWDFGFRTALLSRSEDAFAAWTDTHLSSTDRSQDLFATTVRPPVPASGDLTALAVSVLAVLAGALVLFRQRQASRLATTGGSLSGEQPGDAAGEPPPEDDEEATSTDEAGPIKEDGEATTGEGAEATKTPGEEAPGPDGDEPCGPDGDEAKPTNG